MTHVHTSATQKTIEDQLILENEMRSLGIERFREATLIREEQEQASSAAQTFDNSLKTRAAEATASTAAGESGVGGLSIEGLMQDFGARGARANDRIAQQGEWTQAQLESEKTASGDQAVSQINSVQPGNFGILNFADAAVRIGGSAVTAMTNYQKSQINSYSQ